MSTSRNRQLAAILFADILGYTTLMQNDEVSARRNLEKFRNTLTQKVTKHNGQIVNNYGDGYLCIFNSAVEAMTCAKEVQLIFLTAPKVPFIQGIAPKKELYDSAAKQFPRADKVLEQLNY